MQKKLFKTLLIAAMLSPTVCVGGGAQAQGCTPQQKQKGCQTWNDPEWTKKSCCSTVTGEKSENCPCTAG